MHLFQNWHAFHLYLPFSVGKFIASTQWIFTMQVPHQTSCKCKKTGYERRKIPCHDPKKQKWGCLTHAFGLTYNLKTLRVFFKDQFCLLKLLNCLHKTEFPFSFDLALARAAHALSMASLHSLKCFVIFSSDTLCSSRSWIITYCASLSYFLSQFTLFSLDLGEVGDNLSARLCQVGVSIIFSISWILNSLFSW